jgi:hypothetical protein
MHEDSAVVVESWSPDWYDSQQQLWVGAFGKLWLTGGKT